MKFWRICLLMMFLLGFFSGVLLCIVGLRLCQYQHFWIIDSEWLTNGFAGQEGPPVFLLKAWSRLLEGVGFYTTGSPESVCETFSDVNNPVRDEPVHKKAMAKFIEDTNQGTPGQGDSFSFRFFENVGAHFMATFNIPGLDVGLPIWLWTTLNVPNALDASQIRTLCHGNHMDVDPSPSALSKSTPFSFPSSGEIVATSNEKYKRNRKRKSSKNKSPTSASHVGDLSSLYELYWGLLG
jgi:hypothetical protein